MMKKELILFILLVCSTVVFAETCGTGSTQGMQHYWKLDQAAGPVVDSYGANDGSAVNGVTRNATGKVNKAFSFDGNDDHVVTSENVSYLSSFTYEFWTNVTDDLSSSYHVLFLHGTYDPGCLFRYVNPGVLRCYVDNSQYIDSTTLFDDEKWHHVAMTADGSNFRLFIDGVEEGNISWSGITSSKKVYLAQKYDGIYRTEARIDEVAIYNRSLNASEIMQHYNLGNNGQPLCEIGEQGVIPEVNGGATLQILVLLIVALLVGALLLHKN